MAPREYLIISLIALLATSAIIVYMYPSIPPIIASHWNMEGTADGFSQKEMIFLPLAIALGVLVLLEFLPRFDPLQKNYAKFEHPYGLFRLTLVLFFCYLALAMLAFNFYEFNFSYAMIPALAALFYILGTIMGKLRRNWFIGIRTPWTVSSDVVWEKTHQKASVIFRFLGILLLFLLVIPQNAVLAMVAFAVISVAYLVWYSYSEWKKQY